MISYLKHYEIDKARWDRCISQSLDRRVYAFSWYLDIVSPAWEALVSDNYSSVFPLTPGRKAGINYLFQPYFAQQLGLFSLNPIDKEDADRFMNCIPSRFRYVDIQVTPGFVPGGEDTMLIPRANHELDLGGTYEEIVAGFSQNTRRNIRKAMDSGVNTGRNLRPEELVRLFRENFGKREGKLNDIHYQRMEKLMATAAERGSGHVRGAFDEEGLLSSAAFFLNDGARVYFLFAASAPQARENGAMFLLIEQFIKENAGANLILDFEGGDDPNLGRFYKSFGAREILYHRVLRNRLPGLMKAGLMLGRMIRERVK
ncbi:MAG: GNAT family N-acetyltransferase [Bacteroidota bacterium]